MFHLGVNVQSILWQVPCILMYWDWFCICRDTMEGEINYNYNYTVWEVHAYIRHGVSLLQAYKLPSQEINSSLFKPVSYGSVQKGMLLFLSRTRITPCLSFHTFNIHIKLIFHLCLGLSNGRFPSNFYNWDTVYMSPVFHGCGITHFTSGGINYKQTGICTPSFSQTRPFF